MSSDVNPAPVFPPGHFIEEQLGRRDWSQADLAAILGRPVQVVNELIAGKRTVTPETATGLAEAFGTSVEVWLRVEALYQASKLETDPGVALRAKVFTKGPIQDLIRRGWITGSRDAQELADSVVDLLKLPSIDDEPRFDFYAPRQAIGFHETTPALVAWLRRAEQMANDGDEPIGTFSADSLELAMDKLREATRDIDGVARVSQILSEAGIRFLIVEHLPRTRVDGATFWLADGAPVIVMSMRYERIDYFWHTLRHEVGHVKAGDGKETDGCVDVDLPGTHTPVPAERPASEVAADEFAASSLIDQDALAAFIAFNRPHYSRRKILDFAHHLNIHPGILVGQLQYRGEILYSHSRDLLVSVRDIIVASATTDGWKKSKRSA